MPENKLTKNEIASLYRKLFKTYVIDSLKPYGFLKLKSTGMYRVTSEGVLQIFHFVKNHYGTNEVDVSMTIYPVFQDFEYLVGEPGINFGYFKNGLNNSYFSFKNEKVGTKNFEEIRSLIIDKGMPLFDKYTTIESLIEVYNNQSNEFKPPHSECWKYYGLALLYAAKRDYKMSKNFFDKCATAGKDVFVEYICSWFERIGLTYYTRIDEAKYQEYSQKSIDELFRISIKKNDHWAIKLAKKCEEVLNAIESGKKNFNDILEDNRTLTIEKLGLR